MRWLTFWQRSIWSSKTCQLTIIQSHTLKESGSCFQTTKQPTHARLTKCWRKLDTEESSCQTRRWIKRWTLPVASGPISLTFGNLNHLTNSTTKQSTKPPSKLSSSRTELSSALLIWTTTTWRESQAALIMTAFWNVWEGEKRQSHRKFKEERTILLPRNGE